MTDWLRIYEFRVDDVADYPRASRRLDKLRNRSEASAAFLRSGNFLFWTTEQADKLVPIKSGQTFERPPKRADSDAS